MELKEKILRTIDDNNNEFREIALSIHENPELGFDEEFASNLLTEYLEKNGFVIERGVAQISTAFTAVWGEDNGPTIGIIAEYDALPDLGHACGHNIIAASAVGTAVAIKKAVPDFKGKIKVIGTPAEEGGGGKIYMIEEGIFDDLDVAMMVHPKNKTMVLRGGLACVGVKFKFYGKESHASSAPEEGASALEALLNSYNAINSIRQFMTDDVRVHGIVTNGGEAPNIVPNYCEAQFIIRAKDIKGLEIAKEKVYEAVRSSSRSLGCYSEIEEGLIYAERNNNVTLANLFKENWESIGVKVDPPPKIGGLGSSDIGNVGQITPTIHPYIRIGDNINHTHEFTRDSKSETGMAGLNYAIKGLALTTLDLVYNKSSLQEVKEEFVRWKESKNAN